MSFIDLAEQLESTARRPVVQATGSEGDAYLCHRFLVHAAQAHHGKVPRFIAQPALEPLGELEIDRPDYVCSPVEEAMRPGLGIE